MLSSHHDMFFCVEGTYNISVFSPLFFPGREWLLSLRGSGEEWHILLSSFSSLSIFGNQVLLLHPWSLRGPYPCVGRAMEIKCYLLLGVQVRQTLKFNTEKPTVVTHQKPHSPKPVLPVLSDFLYIICPFFASVPSNSYPPYQQILSCPLPYN